jgi:hypothetical protein
LKINFYIRGKLEIFKTILEPKLTEMRNATYRGIPCWYNPINEEVRGKNFNFDRRSLTTSRGISTLGRG